MLCVVALSFLFLLPILLFPLYYTGAGALVTEVVEVSSPFIFKFYVLTVSSESEMRFFFFLYRVPRPVDPVGCF